MALNTQLADATAVYPSGIYSITNLLNGKKYIGSAVNISKRCADHRRMLTQNKHHSIKLQRSWSKYGSNTFLFSVVLYCARKDLLVYEQLAIDAYATAHLGYNMSPTAGNSIGVIASEETKAKQRAAKIGRKLSEEHKAKIGAAGVGNKHRIGFRLSEEEKQARRAFRHSDAAIAKISAANKGRDCSNRKPMTEETKRKISVANKGRKHTPEHNAKVSEAMRIRVFTTEHRQRMSDAAKKRAR